MEIKRKTRTVIKKMKMKSKIMQEVKPEIKLKKTTRKSLTIQEILKSN